ncbi:MAG: cysteate synthase [Nitrospiraceae bacterium]|nr:MAG: cysteate synthase [Nitrospiraceae bacterium]
MSHYNLKCRKCGAVTTDTGCITCEHCKDALLVTEYNESNFLERDRKGVWKFNWLPVHNPEFTQPGPVVFRSERLAEELGLNNLFIAFNGYWPERGAHLQTCTFKEFEAAVVLENARSHGIKGMVAASAGNTARAFAHLSTVTEFPMVIVVPRMCLFEMWYLEASLRIPTLALEDGDYSDAIDLARRIALTLGYPFEGGVKNIAKRDGLGIVLLEAVSRIGRLPDRYFQAVGSGAGAVAVWEMSERFLSDGRFGSRLPVLHLAQNLPFAPMVKAWEKGSRELFREDLNPELIGLITTRVLSTRYPAYSITGGIFDALHATGGMMYGIENNDVYAAMELFERAEGIDIVPAAGVGVAALCKAVGSGHIKKDETVLLNITGGGEKKLKEHMKTYRVEPVFVSKSIRDEEMEELLCNRLKVS